MMKEFQTLPRTYWETLDGLQTNGWEPLINWLSDEARWHINLTHVTAPVPVVAYFPADQTVREISKHHYRLHGYGASLAQAMDDVFMQVKGLLEPKPPKETNGD